MQRAYLMELSGLFDPAYVRGEKRMGDEEATTALGRVAGLVDAFLHIHDRAHPW